MTNTLDKKKITDTKTVRAIPITGCRGCSTTAGRMGCITHQISELKVNTKTWEQDLKEMTGIHFKNRVVYVKGEYQKYHSFIHNLLSAQLQEVAEGVEKMKRGTHNYTNSHDAIMNSDKDYGFNQAIDDVVSYLKGEMKV